MKTTRYNPASAYHCGRREGFAAGVIATVMVALIAAVIIAQTGCQSTNTQTIPAPPPIQLERAP